MKNLCSILIQFPLASARRKINYQSFDEKRSTVWKRFAVEEKEKKKEEIRETKDDHDDQFSRCFDEVLTCRDGNFQSIPPTKMKIVRLSRSS